MHIIVTQINKSSSISMNHVIKNIQYQIFRKNFINSATVKKRRRRRRRKEQKTDFESFYATKLKLHVQLAFCSTESCFVQDWFCLAA